jgi:hypothetical protein
VLPEEVSRAGVPCGWRWAIALLSALVLFGCASPPAEDLGRSVQAVCSSTTFSASPQGASPGTTVTWTASAACDTGDTPQYEFWMQPPGGGWSIVQPYGSSSTYAWTTTGLADGVYDFEVWVENQGSSAPYEAYQDVTYTLGNAPAPCTGGTLSFNPASAASPGRAEHPGGVLVDDLLGEPAGRVARHHGDVDRDRGV